MKNKILITPLLFVLISAIIYTYSANLVTETSQNAVGEEKTVIIIDAGHGGKDGGSEQDGVKEKDINLDIAIKLNGLFRLFGYETVLTRNGDYSTDGGEKFNKRLDLDNRVRLINSYENKVVISIHVNEFEESRYFGAQMFYKKTGNNALWAEKTMLRFKALQPENDRISKQINNVLYLYSRIDCPVLLAECGFLSNAAERELLKDEAYRMKIAMVLFSGYTDYQCSEV